MHGKLFQEEYEKLIKKVENKYNKTVTLEMRNELKNYREGILPIDGEQISFRE